MFKKLKETLKLNNMEERKPKNGKFGTKIDGTLKHYESNVEFCKQIEHAMNRLDSWFTSLLCLRMKLTKSFWTAYLGTCGHKEDY